MFLLLPKTTVICRNKYSHIFMFRIEQNLHPVVHTKYKLYSDGILRPPLAMLSNHDKNEDPISPLNKQWSSSLNSMNFNKKDGDIQNKEDLIANEKPNYILYHLGSKAWYSGLYYSFAFVIYVGYLLAKTAIVRLIHLLPGLQQSLNEFHLK